ncbi:hypothetical protein E5P1_00403 (plasmid) [Variovorax sp. PBL-E5]|nr:hypothetical protein SRS16P1_00405 [Variovorax sp. SRS16]VTU43004.1 hypothetical protein E5P1_00403 [Variovorax sp. PBL-E5]
MPVRRNMATFNGDSFKCGCGGEHTFDTAYVPVLLEGFNGRFVVACPRNNELISLIKTKMKFGILYKELELLAAHDTGAEPGQRRVA